ncbi:sulfurtransferase-like selenium metabolism protein YedF [Helicobacter ganmani]|uniref:sulfurtransferase-like selenium metabolism protein YedF n=1 Tax=Helicobacter ganmani TaxID=60246 RepID=UPI0039E85C99
MKKVLLIKDDSIGENSELGRKLILGFLSTMKECNPQPQAIYLLNRGVLLATTNAAGVEVLKSLEAQGIAIFSCQTCLEHFGLLESLKVGQVGNAKATLNALLNAGDAVSL